MCLKMFEDQVTALLGYFEAFELAHNFYIIQFATVIVLSLAGIMEQERVRQCQCSLDCFPQRLELPW